VFRFLSWHRVYLYKMEVLLGHYIPDIRIPYWDWANDHELPSWVNKPSGVTRGPDTTRTLPTAADVSDILMKSTYIEFTSILEDAHNHVHNWAGGTMKDLMYSPKDPMFWLHHANVDRIWSLWKKTHKEKPPLSDAAAVMDPWPDTILDANLVQHYFYYYK
jgi:tyrosinase